MVCYMWSKVEQVCQKNFFVEQLTESDSLVFIMRFTHQRVLCVVTVLGKLQKTTRVMRRCLKTREVDILSTFKGVIRVTPVFDSQL